MNLDVRRTFRGVDGASGTNKRLYKCLNVGFYFCSGPWTRPDVQLSVSRQEASGHQSGVSGQTLPTEGITRVFTPRSPLRKP